MKKGYFEVSALIILILFFMVSSVLAFPNFINYQGQLTDPDDNLLNGDYVLTFKIYSTETEGEPLWSEQHTVMVTNGLYNAELGTINPFPSDLFETEMLYLEVIILNTDTGLDETLSPRIPFTSTGFSMKAKDAETVAWSNIAGKPAAFADDTDDVNDADSDPNNEIQTLSANGDRITLSDGGSITVPYAINADTLDGKHASEFGDGHSLDAQDGMPADVVYVDNAGNINIGSALFVSSAGNIGIGTDMPAGRLDVGGSDLVVDPNNGNIGINTTAPEAKLHVNGSVYFEGGNGDLNFDGMIDVIDIIIAYDLINPDITGTRDKRLLVAADVDGDGRVTWDDYAMIVDLFLYDHEFLKRDEIIRKIHYLYGAVDRKTFYVNGIARIKGGMVIGGSHNYPLPKAFLHVFNDGKLAAHFNFYNDPNNFIQFSESDGASIDFSRPNYGTFHIRTSTNGSTFTERLTFHEPSGNISMAYNGGNVGIGTTNPGSKLNISGGNILVDWFNGEGRVNLGDSNHYIRSRIHIGVSIGTSNIVDGIILRQDTGNVGIGTTNPSRKLDVTGNVIANAYEQHSDARLKKNINLIENALDKVAALRGVEFEWRIEEYPEKGLTDGRKIGLIAQEVEKVLPEVVSTDNEGYKSVEYGNIVCLLIEAVKAQQLQIEELKSQNTELKKRVEALESYSY